MNTIRQNKIQSYVEEKGVVSIKELRVLCPEVSLMTIHRDLDALERAGILVKVRGGAKSVHHTGDPVFDERMQENGGGKSVIAQKALELIRPHSAVFLDASTTGLILAQQMPDINLNIFTTAPNIALELCRLTNPVISLCCGTMNRKNLALSGQNTLEMLEKINIDLAFIGVSGCSVENGFTCGTEADMLVKRLVIQKARTSVALCDHAKLSRLMPYTFASFADVDYVISDQPLPQPFRETAEAAGITLL